MNYFASIICDDQIHHIPFDEGKAAEVPRGWVKGFTIRLSAEGVLPSVVVIGENGEKEHNLLLNRPLLLNYNPRIVVCITEEQVCEHIVSLPNDFSSITVGRAEDNDVALPSSSLRFVTRKHFRLCRKDGKTTLEDLKSLHGTFVNGKRVTQAELNSGDEISILTVRIFYEGDRLRLENVGEAPKLSPELPSAPGAGAEPFYPSPRMQMRLPGGELQIPTPPAEAEREKFNWLSTLLPAGVTVAIAITMALVFSDTMMMLYSLPMTIVGVIVSVANYFHGSKENKKKLEDNRSKYLEALDKAEKEIEEKREAQEKAMLSADPSPEECLSAVRSRNSPLWNRQSSDADFVSVRIGTGAVPFSVKLSGPQGQAVEGNELWQKAEEIRRAGSTLDGMPIVCNLRNHSIGLVGRPDLTRVQLQNMIFHLATHHRNTDLKIAYFCSNADLNELSWLADLPHTHGAAVGGTYCASSQQDTTNLLNALKQELDQRRQAQGNNSSVTFVPHILLVFFDQSLLKQNHLIFSQYLSKGTGLGASCLVAARGQLPQWCTEILEIKGEDAVAYYTADETNKQSFHPDEISPTDRRTLGRLMKPLYYNNGNTGASLPSSYTFCEMLGVDTITADTIRENWENSDLLTSAAAPSAPIGILEDGSLLSFEAPPASEGAHALVAGTTGAGKSAVLLTLILSLALRYPPEEVSFVVIDFKGGNLADRLEDLPHLRGVVTNLDADTLDRSFVSIDAELIRRQKLIEKYNTKYNINDIIGYDKYAKKHPGCEPLPHLFIVVDECAQLKQQMPQIMAQLNTVAIQGRSLGMHLILSTQTPSGVVDTAMTANILKYLCLRVANAGESQIMLGQAGAEKIVNEGRGYLKVGSSTPILFQSAYSGGTVSLPGGEESTQLQEAVKAIRAYCKSNNIGKLPDIVLPPLPESVKYPKADSAQEFGLVPIGIRDDPAKQYMGSYSLDAFTRNTLIVGSPLMGKTNLLQVILRGAAEMYSPEEVNVYILDFTTLFLGNYASLPHLGGVVGAANSDMIDAFFLFFARQIARRKSKFQEKGVSNFADYRKKAKEAHGVCDLPQILLLVDGLDAVQNYFAQGPIDPILPLCKGGLTYGISVAAATAQSVGTTSYLPQFGNVVALHNNNSNVYGALLPPTKLSPKDPGRCLIAEGKKVYECQSYLTFTGQAEIKDFCEAQAARAAGKHAARIPFVPIKFPAEVAFDACSRFYSGDSLMLGFDYATIEPLSVKLASLGMLGISGQAKEVQNFRRYLLTAASRASEPQAKFYIVDDSISRTLQPLSDLPCVASYSILPNDAVQMLSTICTEANSRYAQVAGGDSSILDTSPTLVLMLNSNAAIAAINGNKTALADWAALTNQLKPMNVCTVFGALSNATIPYGDQVLQSFKANPNLVFVDNLNSLKIITPNCPTTKKFGGAWKKGDGYLFLGTTTACIRIPDCP